MIIDKGRVKKIEVDADRGLGRPTVEVKVPLVKLQLRDLAYLRSLANPKEVRCFASDGVKNRLRFLDLIASAKVPPTEEAVEKLEKEKASLLLKLEAAVLAEDWDALNNISYGLKSNKSRREPTTDDVLTDAGRRILEDGEIKVRVRKVGCL